MIEFAAKIAARLDRAEMRELEREGQRETRKIKGYDVNVEARTWCPRGVSMRTD